MIRIMIADDEKIVIDALNFIIENNFTNVEVVATARSGREAIEKVESSIPDIVFMDIRMPGINGIDAIREIKSRHKNIVCIVLSAFDQFEFAKEAINLGVFEYLLKPVNRVKVVEVVNRAIDMIEVQRKKRQVELEMKEKLQNVIPALENAFIYSITMFKDNKEELLNYKELLGIEEKRGYIITLEIWEEEIQKSLQNKFGNSFQSQKVYAFLRYAAQSINRCIIGPVMLNRVVIFVPTKGGADELSHGAEGVYFAETLLEKLNGKLKGKLKIGIGCNFGDYELLFTSYEQSLEALRNLNGSGILHYTDIPEFHIKNTRYPLHREKLLLQKISLGEVGESIESFRYIFDWLIKEYSDQQLKVKNKLLEIMFLVNRMLWEYDSSYKTREVGVLEEMLLIEDMGELRLWCMKIIEDVASEIHMNQESKIGGIIKKAKEYIEKNYHKTITLDDVSREINVSAQYFSRLFKAEMKENFIDYLTEIRIEKAKKLLDAGSFSIKEICYRIGYSDPNYFSRIFKKREGIPPTEYRRNKNESLVNEEGL